MRSNTSALKASRATVDDAEDGAGGKPTLVVVGEPKLLGGGGTKAVARRRRAAGDAALRLCMVLTMLPRSPRRVAARLIAERLVEAGFQVTLRTVERDLQKLRTVFPVELDSTHKPFGWSLRDAPSSFLGLAVDEPEALAGE